MKPRQPRLPRSYLFVPGDRPDRFDRALASAADMVVLDLEDAVSPDHKNEARQTVVSWLSPQHPVCIRMNGTDTDLRKTWSYAGHPVLLPLCCQRLKARTRLAGLRTG